MNEREAEPTPTNPPPAADGAAPAQPAERKETLAEIWQRLGPVGWLAVLAASLPAIGGILLLVYMPSIGEWLRGHADVGVAIYVAAFAVLAGTALLPTYAQAVLGGWSFGFYVGLPAALGGFLGGAVIGYVIARTAARDRVTKLLDEHPRWRAVYDTLLRSGFGKTLLIVTLLRVPPSSPFAMTNLVLAATRVPLIPYALGTLIGMAPRTAFAVWIASRIEVLSRESFKLGGWLPFVISVVVTLVVLVIIGQLASGAVQRVTGMRIAQRESGDAAQR